VTGQADAPSEVPHVANIRDVAREAGVSYQTVSRVLNGHPNIRAETRQRVLDAVARLDFRPNRAARMLATSRSHTIGVLAAINGSYYGPTSSIAAIEDAAREAGYSTMLANPRVVDATSLREAVRHLIDEGVEGIAVLAPQTRTAQVLADLGAPIPIVTMQTELRDADAGLSVDNELGAAIAAQHLLGLGHRRIALVAGPDDWSEALARTRGFEGALRDAGLEPTAVAAGDWTAESGYLAFQQLRGHGFTAVFCANDQMALGLMHAAVERGLRVPEQLSVVGFDDVPESAHYLPPLTTIRQDFDELGRRAVATLLARVEGSPLEFPTALPPRLTVRASTMGAPV
jgi:DNA-binding LacI/PurR family transcriptional regulator